RWVAASRSVTVGTAANSARARAGVTGIDKRPTPGAVQVTDPGPRGGGTGGLSGDAVCDTADHGGSDQAVYAYALEDLLDWPERLERPLPPGTFGGESHHARGRSHRNPDRDALPSRRHTPPGGVRSTHPVPHLRGLARRNRLRQSLPRGRQAGYLSPRERAGAGAGERPVAGRLRARPRDHRRLRVPRVDHTAGAAADIGARRGVTERGAGPSPARGRRLRHPRTAGVRAIGCSSPVAAGTTRTTTDRTQRRSLVPARPGHRRVNSGCRHVPHAHSGSGPD